MNNFQKMNKKSGYTLVELIIYVSILSAVSFLIINTVLSFNKSYQNVLVLRRLDHSAIDVMERVTREIRSSRQIDNANSSFGSSPSVLSLISRTDGVNKTTKFYLEEGVVKIDVNDEFLGPLTSGKVSVTNLIFNVVNTSVSSAIKIDLELTSSLGEITRSKIYHSTIVLKDM